MAFEHGREHPIHTAKVSMVGNDYEYSFQPSISLSSPKPAKVFNIMSRKIVPKGGGFNAQQVVGGEPVMGMIIPSNISRDVVEELFAALREFGVDIHITNESYRQPETPVDSARSTYGYSLSFNIYDPNVPMTSEIYEKSPDGSQRVIERTVHPKRS